MLEKVWYLNYLFWCGLLFLFWDNVLGCSSFLQTPCIVRDSPELTVLLCLLSPGITSIQHPAPCTWFWGSDLGASISWAKSPVRNREVLIRKIPFLMYSLLLFHCPLRDGGQEIFHSESEVWVRRHRLGLPGGCFPGRNYQVQSTETLDE